MVVIKTKLERSELNKLIEICVGTKEAVAVPSYRPPNYNAFWQG